MGVEGGEGGQVRRVGRVESLWEVTYPGERIGAPLAMPLPIGPPTPAYPHIMNCNQVFCFVISVWLHKSYQDYIMDDIRYLMTMLIL